jgi:tellurite methyltransferase
MWSARAVKGAEPEASPFLLAELDRLRGAARGPVLDVACGAGRNAWPVAALGRRVVGVDRDPRALARLAAEARRRTLSVSALRADIESGHELPFRPGVFAAVLVFRFLFRPLAPALAAALRPGGLLIYETFTLDQMDLAQGPRNPSFLLEPGELPKLFPELLVLRHEELHLNEPRPQALARLVARRPLDGAGSADEPRDSPGSDS